MGLFQMTEMKQGFIKMGMYGDPKSGKTYTASLVALGLHKLIGSKKPITFFDTETGSEYVLPTLFKPAGIELQSIKSRSFSDLMAATREAMEISDILIVDSVTHVWKELMDAYKRKKQIDYVEFQDWAVLKAEWAAFTDLYLNCKLHMIVCGRSQDVYGETVSERGKKEKTVVGTKMATEKNLAYEPSLLIEMEKVSEKDTGFLIPRAWVLGDRFSQLDGKCFDKPTFETFLPHIRMLNLGGEHVGIDTERSSEALFHPDSADSRYEYGKKKDIAVENLHNEIDRRWSGQSVDQKNSRMDVLNALFNTASKTAIENLPLSILEKGLERLRSGEFDGLGKAAEEPAKDNGAKAPAKKKVA
jgi:hypothetical protein